MSRETIKQLEHVRDALLAIDHHVSQSDMVVAYVKSATLQVEFAIKEAKAELFRTPYAERQ